MDHVPLFSRPRRNHRTGRGRLAFLYGDFLGLLRGRFGIRLDLPGRLLGDRLSLLFNYFRCRLGRRRFRFGFYGFAGGDLLGLFRHKGLGSLLGLFRLRGISR